MNSSHGCHGCITKNPVSMVMVVMVVMVVFICCVKTNTCWFSQSYQSKQCTTTHHHTTAPPHHHTHFPIRHSYPIQTEFTPESYHNHTNQNIAPNQQHSKPPTHQHTNTPINHALGTGGLKGGQTHTLGEKYGVFVLAGTATGAVVGGAINVPRPPRPPRPRAKKFTDTFLEDMIDLTAGMMVAGTLVAALAPVGVPIYVACRVQA